MFAGSESASASAEELSGAEFSARWLGSVNYTEARALQRSLVEAVQKDSAAAECVLFCEHEPVITLGRRLGEEARAELARAAGLPAICTGRGGEAVYHGPGQLVMYPVLNLRRRRLGAKAFIFAGLEALAEVSRARGVKAEAGLTPPGVWLPCGAKLGFAGVRIEHGVSDHGFALNLSPNLDVFTLFPCCGDPRARVTSWAAELVTDKEFSAKSVAKHLSIVFSNLIANRRGAAAQKETTWHHP